MRNPTFNKLLEFSLQNKLIDHVNYLIALQKLSPNCWTLPYRKNQEDMHNTVPNFSYLNLTIEDFFNELYREYLEANKSFNPHIRKVVQLYAQLHNAARWDRN